MKRCGIAVVSKPIDCLKVPMFAVGFFPRKKKGLSKILYQRCKDGKRHLEYVYGPTDLTKVPEDVEKAWSRVNNIRFEHKDLTAEEQEALAATQLYLHKLILFGAEGLGALHSL